MMSNVKEIGISQLRCVDSGADCHVLPLSFYSEELGTTELPELRMITRYSGPCSGDEILWSEMEMFACAEEWQGFEVMEFEKVEDVVITILERTPQEVSRYVHERKKE